MCISACRLTLGVCPSANLTRWGVAVGGLWEGSTSGTRAFFMGLALEDVRAFGCEGEVCWALELAEGVESETDFRLRGLALAGTA